MPTLVDVEEIFAVGAVFRLLAMSMGDMSDRTYVLKYIRSNDTALQKCSAVTN